MHKLKLSARLLSCILILSFLVCIHTSQVQLHTITITRIVHPNYNYSSKPVMKINTITKPESINYIDLTDDEIYELATLVFLESGAEPYECQLAIASVVINRMTTQNVSLHDVIYAKNQFSPAYLIDDSEPSESTLNAVKEVIENGPTIPEYVTFFRADYYHNWSELITPYIQYGNTYFSADTRLM